MKYLIIMMNLFFALNAFALKAPEGFKQEKVVIDGMNFNVYKGGQGEPLLLIHGYAQSSLMWVKAMEYFKDNYTIIAPDIRGAGLTDAPNAGYDKVTMATDMKKLLDHYNISSARVVGHDIGLMVAYALAAKFPEKVNKLVLMDAFVPGVGPGDKIFNDPKIWHFRFNGPYAEKLVEGRERIYFDALWDGFSAKKGTFPEESKQHYLSEYSRPGRIRAGFAYFSNMPNDAMVNKELAKNKLKMPVLAMGGSAANGQAVVDTMKIAAQNVQAKVVNNCGHWMMEECPQETLRALDKFLGSSMNLKQAQEANQ